MKQIHIGVKICGILYHFVGNHNRNNALPTAHTAVKNSKMTIFSQRPVLCSAAPGGNWDSVLVCDWPCSLTQMCSLMKL